jgi:uncharacterized delta-60 repeat protein
VRRAALAVTGAALVLTPLGGAAAGRLDPAFDRDGKVVTDFGAAESGEDVLVQPDGRIVVVGWSYSDAAKPAFVLARYRADGSLDRSFGSGGKVRTAIGSAFAVALQRDGKIVAAGQGQAEGNRTSRFALARYNRDGTLDRSFDGDGVVVTDFGLPSTANGVAIQPDGRIIAVGGAGGSFAAARYLSSGALDSTFDGDGRVTTTFTSGRDAAQDVALQRDGKIVVGGYAGWRSFPAFLPPPDFAVARYNADGSLDAAFDGDGTAMTALERAWRSFGHDIAIQADGKILLAGGPLVRYNADGGVDPRFGAGGKVSVSGTRFQAQALQRDGKILVVGTTETAQGDFVVSRLRADGKLDTGYASGGRVTTDFRTSDDGVQAAALQRDGKLVVAGASAGSPGAFDLAVARYVGNPPARCIVPNVRGRTLRVARARIRRASCSVGRVTAEASTRVARSRIVSQSPRPGARLRVGGRVDVVVSSGPRH